MEDSDFCGHHSFLLSIVVAGLGSRLGSFGILM